MESESNGDAELLVTDSPSGSLINKNTEDQATREVGDYLQNPTQHSDSHVEKDKKTQSESRQQTLPPELDTNEVTDNNSKTQTGTDDHDQPVDFRGADTSTDPSPDEEDNESLPKIQSLDESKAANDINETNSELSHTDEVDVNKDEDKDQDQDFNMQTKQKPVPILDNRKVDSSVITEPKVRETYSETQTGIDDHDQPADIRESTQHPPSSGLSLSDPWTESNTNQEPECRQNLGEENVNEKTEKESRQQTLPPELDTNEVTDNNSKTQTGTDDHDQPVDFRGADTSTDPSPDEEDNESLPKIQSLDESKAANYINEKSSELSHTDEVDVNKDEDKDQDQDFNKRTKQKPEPTLESLEDTTSSRLPRKSQPVNSTGGNEKLIWIWAVVFLLVAVVGGFYHFSDSSPPVPQEFNVVDVFNQEMEKLKTSFPTQRPELWRRSLIHLRRHLKTEHPTEPVSLILTSGRGAERTLGCLAQCLARAFSTARNSSVLKINGKSKSSQDSDQVKLDIDSELRKAFEGKKFAAVIHRFEELPPGSTLIFYRYCDHENAAYKNVFLAFTVMLDAEVEVPPEINLGRVEEMVQDHVKQKFVSSDKSAMFNQMDVDKLSGLWSRISHLILPVAAEENIEQQGCEDCD